MNTLILHAAAVIFICTANLPSVLLKGEKLLDVDSQTRAQLGSNKGEKLVDVDSQTRAQLYAPRKFTLPSASNVLPPFLQNLLPSSGKNEIPNAALLLFRAPQLVRVLSRDIVTFADHMVTMLNTVLQLPSNTDIPRQIATVRKLMRNGQIPREYMPYATALVSLLRDQPVLRALQQSISELQQSTSFNLSASGQGLDNLKVNADFNLPSTLITPSIQSSFDFASNPDAADPDYEENATTHAENEANKNRVDALNLDDSEGDDEHSSMSE